MRKFIFGFLRILPFGVALPLGLGAAAVSPEDAVSNLSKWAHWLGIHNVPSWLSAQHADRYFIDALLLFSCLYGYYLFRLWYKPIKNWIGACFSRITKQAKGPLSEPYLSDRDSELTWAIRGMVLRSAWGRWFSSQYLASDTTYRVNSDSNQRDLMQTAAHIVTTAAMNGELEIRGCPHDSRQYELIPREDWRLIALVPEPDIRTIWKIVITPRSNVATNRVKNYLNTIV